MANRTVQTGRLTKDPELRNVGELQVCDMRLAVQRRRGKDGEDRGAFFIDVVAFNALAGVCNTYLHKGSRIYVDGQLDVQEWTGRDDVRRYTPKIYAEQVEFLDPSSDSDNGAESQQDTSQEPSEAPKQRGGSRAKAAA